MPRGAISATRLFFVVLLIPLLVLLVSACGRSREEPTPTPLPPTQAELAARNTPLPPAQETPAEAPAESSPEKNMTTASGLQYTELRAGSGPKPQAGEIVSVHYTGTLEDGTVFDSSRERGEPISFPLGVGYVIPGWDEGIALMNQGGQATLVIPPDLAYGAEGSGDVIPANATLTFDVELVAIAPGSPVAPTAVDEASYTTTEQGIKYVDLVAGDGPTVNNGQLVVAHYTGWLEDGTKFDSSVDRGEPFTFNLGMGQVIAGWDLGMRGMKVGATRQLVIPPQLGYGAQGAGGVIPPNATLIFEIELLEVQ
jgi:peptidylprolyl isomerase